MIVILDKWLGGKGIWDRDCDRIRVSLVILSPVSSSLPGRVPLAPFMEPEDRSFQGSLVGTQSPLVKELSGATVLGCQVPPAGVPVVSARPCVQKRHKRIAIQVIEETGPLTGGCGVCGTLRVQTPVPRAAPLLTCDSGVHGMCRGC